MWAFSSVRQFLEAVWQELFCFVWYRRKSWGRQIGQCVPLPVRVIDTKAGVCMWKGTVMATHNNPAFDWLAPVLFVLGGLAFKAQP